MGVKSTVKITRADAISLGVYLMQQKQQRELEAHFTRLSDKALEDELETLNDEVHNGEGFNNYSIVHTPD